MFLINSRSTFKDEAASKPLDWSFVDQVYLITTGNKERLQKSLTILMELNLCHAARIRHFALDKDDKIRGCFTSHMQVMQEALRDTNDGGLHQHHCVLILEDNLSVGRKVYARDLHNIADCVNNATMWDVVHLSLIPYVPNLSLRATPSHPGLVQVHTTGPDAALGTTAYLIHRRGMQTLVEHYEKVGFTGLAIPNLMSDLLSHRYAVFPTPIRRSCSTPSLVNPQTDLLRSVMFRPFLVTLTEYVLLASGMRTNELLKGLVATLLVVGMMALVWSWRVLQQCLFLPATSISDISVPLLLEAQEGGEWWAVALWLYAILAPLVAATITLSMLGILVAGVVLAPKQ